MWLSLTPALMCFIYKTLLAISRKTIERICIGSLLYYNG